MSKIYGYIQREGQDFYVSTWHGKKLGKCIRTGSTKRKYGGRQFTSLTSESFRCVVNGQQYIGRNGGEGLLINLRPAKPAKLK